jgi:PAS domain S-box-containing protein
MEGQHLAPGPSSSAWKLLVVDDDKEDYIITREMLAEAKGRKYILEWAPSFQAGQEKLLATPGNAEYPNGYRAVLIDYDLGTHNGLELIRWAVAQNYPAPLILFTGQGSHEIDLEAMRAGATLYLTKTEANPLLLERAIRYAVEIKEKEQALRQSEAHLRESEARERAKLAEINAILDAVPAIVWVTHDLDAREVFGNWAAHQFLRIPQGHNLSKSASDLQESERYRVFQNGKELSTAEMPLEISALTGKPLRNFEEDVVFGDGTHAHLLGNVTPLFDENGQPRGAVAAFIDITERNLIDQELQERGVQLQRALAKAEESQRTLAALMENTPEGITIAEGPEVNIRMVSRYGEDLLGGSATQRTANDVAGQWNVYFEDGIQLMPVEELPLVRAIHRGEVVKNQELIQVNAEGKRLTLSCNAGPIRDASGAIIGGVVTWRDITEQKLAIEALRESEHRYRELAHTLDVERGKLAAAFDNLPVGVGLGDAQGNILTFNSVGLKLHGFDSLDNMYSRMEQYFQGFELRYVDGANMPFEEWPISRALRGEFIHDYEVLLHNLSNGAERVLTYSVAPVRGSDGQVLLIVYVIQDLTERKQVEYALRESEGHFRQLADALPHLVWTARPDGSVDYYNRRYLEYDGISPLDADNWTWQPVLHPEDIQATVDAWQHAVRTGEIYQAEHRVRTADGSFRWHLSRGWPVRDAQGNVIRWFGTATDIHDMKQAEAVLAEYAVKLQQSNRELEQFAFVASHDLQEPLRKIRLFGSAIQQKLRGKLDDETQDSLQRMIGASERMQAMIQDLLELSRISTQGRPFTRVNLSQVAADVVSDLEARIHRTGGQVIIEPLPVIEADPMQIHQVMQNIIANALKFHRPGTPPVVKIYSQGDQEKNSPRQRVCIYIQDNGIGFDETFFEQMLQPFKRLHGRSKYEGNGMGLAIVKKIIDRHQGKITARSRPNEGATFIITLPVKQNA